MVYGPPKSPMGSHIQVSVSFGNVWGDGNDTGHFSLSPISIENVRSHCNPVNSLKRPAEFPYADDSQIAAGDRWLAFMNPRIMIAL